MANLGKIIFTATSDLYTDQRMQRICLSLYNEGYQVLLIGRFLGTAVSFDFDSKQIKCLFNSGFLFYAEFNLRLMFYLLFTRANAICSVDLDTLLPGKLVARIKSIKHIYDAHEYYVESPELDDRPSVKRLWERIASITIKNLDLAYTVNQSIANRMMRKYQTDFKVIRNLPFKQKIEIENSSEESESFLFYQGVLNKGRGLENLILAMQSVDGLKLKIAGKGDLDVELRSLVAKHHLQYKIEFLGLLTPEELRIISAKAWLGFNLLDGSNQNYYLSLANKFFDYMMTGTPSISMNFPEYQIINDKLAFAYLIEDFEVSTIVEAIKSLQSDPNKMLQLRKNAIEASKYLNWEFEEKKLLKLYSELFSIQ